MTFTLTRDRLRTLLHYDPETGFWTWLVVPSPGVKIGARAGCVNKDGYIQIGIDGSRYVAHRLAFLYMTGDWPPCKADHKNTFRTDNRWENLRPATDLQNVANSNKPRHNKSGFKGVSFNRQAGRWMAGIRYRGKQIWLGLHDTPEEAHAVYRAKAEELHGKYARAA